MVKQDNTFQSQSEKKPTGQTENKTPIGNIFTMAEKAKALEAEKKKAAQQKPFPSPIRGKETYFSSTDRDTANLELLADDDGTAKDFEVLQNLGSIVIPQNIGDLFKDFNPADIPVTETQTGQQNYDDEIDTSVGNFGSIVLDHRALSNLAEADYDSGQVADDILAAAFSGDRISSLAKDFGYLNTNTIGRRRRRRSNPYTGNSQHGESLEDLLSHLHLPADSLEELQADNNSSRIIGAELQNSSGTTDQKASLFKHNFPQQEQTSHISVEDILNIPRMDDSAFSGDDFDLSKLADADNATPDGNAALQVQNMAAKVQSGLTPSSYNTPLTGGPDYLEGFLYEDMVPTSFFDLYDDPHHIQASPMWGHGSELRTPFAHEEPSLNEHYLHIWDDFDIEKDWIDISDVIAPDYTIEVLQGERTTAIIIKSPQGVVTQGLTVASPEITLPFVDAMTEHITNPYLDDILSLGARYGVFAIDSQEKWFSKTEEKLDISKFSEAQRQLLALQRRIESKEAKKELDAGTKDYLAKRGLIRNDSDKFERIGLM